jgi:hypothetical protein
MPPRVAAPSARPSYASISTMWAVTSALGGSVTAPKSQKGSLAGSGLVLSTSKAAQPPSLDCIPTDHATPRSAAPASSISARRSASTTTAVSSTSG